MEVRWGAILPLGGSGQPSICSQAGLPDAAQIESYLDQLLQLALEIPIPESESEKNDLKRIIWTCYNWQRNSISESESEIHKKSYLKRIIWTNSKPPLHLQLPVLDMRKFISQSLPHHIWYSGLAFHTVCTLRYLLGSSFEDSCLHTLISDQWYGQYLIRI